MMLPGPVLKKIGQMLKRIKGNADLWKRKLPAKLPTHKKELNESRSNKEKNKTTIESYACVIERGGQVSVQSSNRTWHLHQMILALESKLQEVVEFTSLAMESH